MTTTATDSRAAPGLLSVEQARERMLQAVTAVNGAEQLHLRAALGRVLAQAVVSAIDVPSFANSAMDGYAVRGSDCAVDRVRLKILGASFAGAPFAGSVNKGECVRIMTGAVMPDGADAVIIQEQVERDGEWINFPGKDIASGLNVRYPGEDTRRGDTVLEAGTRLGAAELGLLASVGVNEVRVARKLRVAFFSTGDELTGIGTPLAPGKIYDSNRYALFGMLSAPGIECHDLGNIPDQREAVRDAFRQAREISDLVLTSGGVSVGEADYVTETLRELGEINFWRIAMKPGKPLAFGRLGNAVFFGLPGNPVSAMVTFYQFVLPAIHKMTGEPQQEPLLITARCSDVLKKAPGRAEFQRGMLHREADGSWSVSSTGVQGSHLLSSMTRANCLIHLPADSTGAQQGEVVVVQPFADFHL